MLPRPAGDLPAGGGAYRYADLFKQRLGVVLDCEDEMSCLVSGCNFLLKAINHEAFTFENGATNFVPTDGEAGKKGGVKGREGGWGGRIGRGVWGARIGRGVGGEDREEGGGGEDGEGVGAWAGGWDWGGDTNLARAE